MNYTLITGASSGIGKEFAYQLAAKKHHLILVARSEGKLNQIAEELKNLNKIDIKIVPINLFDHEAPEKLFEKCLSMKLTIDFLINNAGVGLIGRFDNFSIKKIEEMINLNVLNLTKMSYLFIPMIKKYHGKIINVASQVAFAPAPYMSAYAGTKSYVLSFTEAIKHEFKEDLTIMALCPGPTYTHFFERTDASPEDINFKFREPKEVVEEALSGIENKQAVTIVGWENKLMIFLYRFLPRSLQTRLNAMMVKNGKNKP